MTPPESWSSAKAWRDFLDLLTDAVLVIDTRSRVTFANTAALRFLPCDAGTPIAQLQTTLGDPAVRWLQHAALGAPEGSPPPIVLPDGRHIAFRWLRLDGKHGVVRFDVKPTVVTSALPTAPEVASAASAVRETIRLFWDSPFPVTLQDAGFRIVDVNDAFVSYLGYKREELIGLDPVNLIPVDEQTSAGATRTALGRHGSGATSREFAEGRLVDAEGRERWYQVARRALAPADGEPLYLAVLQDTTSEHVAKERADRSIRELDDWFDLSPIGMVLFDDSGLLVRTNPAFDGLVGRVPVSLAQASPSLQQLLAWGGGGATRLLQPDSRPIESHGFVMQPNGERVSLRAIVRSYRSAGGQTRYMAVVEDRSIEEERDLAHMQIGAMIDTAGVGLATFQESSGWVRPPQGGSGGGGPASNASAALQNINRDIVVPESMPEYERLQQALQTNQRAEVRYAITHPELGMRWLLTRVEPATLASGKRTTSVVTLDVTDQHTSRRRSEQLLREMTTILESTAAGIAYLRGNALVRCNQRFEAMLGLRAGGIAGSGFGELFGRHAQAHRMAEEIQKALADDAAYETEFELAEPSPEPGREAETRWYSLSVRRAGTANPGVLGAELVSRAAPMEAIAVLSDVTRLKSQQVELEQLAQAVANQAEQTRSILDSVLVGIVIVGSAGIEWMNRSARRMFAGHLADFMGQPMATVATDEDDHPFRQTQYLNDLVEGQAETFECRVQAKDGREFWVVGNAVATGAKTSRRQLTYALLDIERRRQAEAAMSEARISLQRVIDAAPLAIALLDAHTLKVVQANHVAAQTVRRHPIALIGRSTDDIFGPALAAARKADMVAALASSDVTSREYRFDIHGETQVWDARYVPLAAAHGEPPDKLLLVATDVTEQRAAQEARLEAAIAQREMLVREVHHRIKNNLQGVAGLLQQIAQRKPEVAAAIDEVVGQVQAIAQVYGLQVGETGPLQVVSVMEAITGSVQRTFGRPIRCSVSGHTSAEWTLPEVEAIPIALTINELLTNAIKHRSIDAPADDPVACRLDCFDTGVQFSISSRASLPAGFNLARIPGAVSGLGLVRALLPRKSAELTIEQHESYVVATIALRPPGVARLALAPIEA